MTRKITLRINRINFTVNLEDRSADFIESKIREDFLLESDNDVKVLLSAYLKRTEELFELDTKLRDTLDSLKE